MTCVRLIVLRAQALFADVLPNLVRQVLTKRPVQEELTTVTTGAAKQLANAAIPALIP